tara:strand:- start:57 stop:398 length:342 start_codon:yes stop_codon:yes gene_type:complete
MGGSDSPPPTIIIEYDVEQETGLQNNLPKSSKIQINLLVAIIGLIMFIIGAGLSNSGDTSGFKWLFFGILILSFSGIILAVKKWGMKTFIIIFILGMVIFFVLDYIISGQPFF